MTATVNAPKEIEKSEKHSNEKKLIENLSYADELTLEDLAPDGGWGWMVAVGMTTVFVVTIGPSSCFSIIFSTFLNDTGLAGSVTTLLNSMFLSSFSFSGVITNTLLKKYSIMPVGVVSAVLYTISNICMAFVQHVYQMAIIFFIQGITLGIMMTLCTTTFNAYFVKKRAKVMSVCQVFGGIAGIVYPLCINELLNNYGFRGTSALVGIMSSHCIFAMLTIHPVQWHTRNPEEVLKEKFLSVNQERTLEKDHKLVFDVRNFGEIRRHSTDFVKGNGRSPSIRSLKEGEHEVPLLIEAFKTFQQRVGSHSDTEGAFRPRLKTGSMQDLLKKRMSTLSAASLASITHVGALGDLQYQAIEEVAKISVLKEEQKKSFSSLLSDFFELSLMKDGAFLNIAFGISMIFISDITFCSFLPLMMESYHFTKEDATNAVMIGAVAELVSRILLAGFTMYFEVKARYLFLVASIGMMISKIVFIYCTSLTSILVLLVFIGLTRSWLQVPQPLVIAEHFTVERFPAAYGLFTVISGVIGIICGPLIGLVKDKTNDFIVSQYLMIGMTFLCIVPWIVEILVLEVFPRNRKKLENST